MKVLILNGAKVFGSSNGELNTLLCDTAKTELESLGHTVLYTKIDAGYNISEEAKKVLDTDIIIWQYPAWWMAEPWIVKKYLDEVFMEAAAGLLSSDGRHANDPEHCYGSGGLAVNKKYMICTTWNAPKTAFDDKNEFFEGRGIDGVCFAMHKAMQFCGLKKLPSFICNDVIKNPKVNDYIKNYKAHIKANF